MKYIVSGQKHQGRTRIHNEDSILLEPDLGLYAVADGVESEPAGEKASLMAVTALKETIQALKLDADSTPPFDYAEGIPLQARALKFSFREVNRKIFDTAELDPKLKGMATTLTAVWFQAGRAFIGNVGDSRAYLIRQGHIQQLTRDHTSLAQGSAGKPAAVEFLESYSSTSEHELTRALGINPDTEVQLAGGTPKPGDYFMLCTDGLYGEIREFELLDAIKSFPPDTAAKKLIGMANDRGGKDNVAVVVIQVA
jgi:PPM family protein phosphatase